MAVISLPKAKKGAAPKLASSSSSSKKDPLASVITANTKTRATLKRLGVKDPTAKKGPTLLDRTFGVLDTLGAGVRSVVHNMNDTPDVNPLAEMGKALKGEKRIEGSDILKDMGVENKWALTLGGIATDILLDPVTYLSLGYSSLAKKAGTSVLDDIARNGDDLVKFAADNAIDLGDDVVKGLLDGSVKARDLGRDVTRELAAAARKVGGESLKSVDKGGIKLLGKTVIPMEGAMEKASYAAKDLLRKIPGSEVIETAFLHGGNSALTPVFREGNELVNASLKRMLQTYSAASANAIKEGVEFQGQLEKLVPDQFLRNILTLGIGDQVDPVAASKAFEVVKNSTAETYDDAIEILRIALEPDMDAILKRAKELVPDISDEELKGLSDAGEMIRGKFAANLQAMRDKGIEAKSLFGDQSFGYMPGMAPGLQTKAAKNATKQTLEAIGVDPAALRDVKGGYGTSALSVGKDASKAYLTPELRAKGIGRDELEAVDDLVRQGIVTEFDAAKLAGAKTASDIKKMAKVDFEDSLIQLLGKPVAGGNSAAKNVISLTGENAKSLVRSGPEDAIKTVVRMVEKDGKMVKTYTRYEVPVAVQDFTRKFGKAFTDDVATKGFMKAYDTGLNIWKKTATSWNIGFHLRNKMSNAWLLWAEGVFDPTAWAQAPLLLTGKGSIDVGKLGTLSADDLLKLASEQRVAVKMAEMSELVGADALRDPLTKVGGAVGEWVENADRLSAFVAALRKGLDPAAAGEMVNKTMYSYAPEAYTTFERTFVQRLIPFYKWMKNNTPHMVELLFKNPGKIAPFGHIQEVGKAVNPIDESIMPDWLRDLQPTSLPMTDNGKPLLLNIDMPYKGLNVIDLIRDGKLDLKQLTSSVSPLIRTPLEILVIKKDLYYGTELSGVKKRVPGYIEKFDDVVANTPLKSVWDTVKGTLGIVEITDKTTGSPYLVMDERMVKFLRDFNPWLNNVGKFMAGQPRTKYDRISMLTGVKPILYDEQQFKSQQAYQDRGDLAQIVAELKSAGLDTTNAPKKKTISLVKGGK